MQTDQHNPDIQSDNLSGLLVLSAIISCYVYRVNPKRMGSIQPKLESLCAADVTLKEYAQRVGSKMILIWACSNIDSYKHLLWAVQI